MTIIADRDRPRVRDVLTRELVKDVELLLFTIGQAQETDGVGTGGQSCQETRELLFELAALSGQLAVTVVDVGVDAAAADRYNVTAVPTVLIRRRSQAVCASENALATAAEIGANVRFLGLPGGYEFSTLLADIVNISRGQTDLSAETRASVRAITSPVHLQVFVTPACPYCPPAARVAHQMAMENPLIVADVIEANEFQELRDRYRVTTVPKTVVNNRVEFVGPLAEAKVLDAITTALSRDE